LSPPEKQGWKGLGRPLQSGTVDLKPKKKRKRKKEKVSARPLESKKMLGCRGRFLLSGWVVPMIHLGSREERCVRSFVFTSASRLKLLVKLRRVLGTMLFIAVCPSLDVYLSSSFYKSQAISHGRTEVSGVEIHCFGMEAE
jgi:hypothetical protein